MVPVPRAAQSGSEATKVSKDFSESLSSALGNFVKGFGESKGCDATGGGNSACGASSGAETAPTGIQQGDTKALSCIQTKPAAFATHYGAARVRIKALVPTATHDDGTTLGATVGTKAAAYRGRPVAFGVK